MKLRSATGLLSVAVVSALGLAACGSSSSGTPVATSSSPTGTASSPSTTTANSKPIVIGFNDNLTGSNASGGAGNLKLAQAAIDYANNTGGISGRKLTLKVLDAGEIGSGKSSSNAIQLAQDGAIMSWGPTTSNDCDLSGKVFDAKKIPQICEFADIPVLAKNDPYTFEGVSAEPTQLAPFVKFIKAQTGIATPKIALLTNFALGTVDLAKKFKALAGQLGYTSAYTGAMTQTDTSVNAYAAGITASKPDAVIVDVFPPFVDPLIKSLRSSGVTAPIIATEGVDGYPLLAAVKDPKTYASEASSILYPGAPGNSPQVKTLLTAMAQAGLKTPAEIDGAETQNVIVPFLQSIAALRACGPNCTGEQLAQKLTTTKLNIPGFVKNYGFSPSFHQGANLFTFWNWNTAKGQVVQTGGSYPAGSLSLTAP